MSRFATVLALLLVAAPLSAQSNKERARALYKEGSQHFALGEFTEALQAFKESFRSSDEPTLLFNIAQCHRQLGDKAQAIQFYRSYLSRVPDAPNAADVHATIDKLEAALAEERALKGGPPTGITEPPGTATTPAAPTLTATAPPPAPPKPIYKKWWFWTAVGVVAVGAAVGIGVGVTRTAQVGTPSSDYGSFRPLP
jgi:tetratricopeptide (TPR) repeat protein